MEIIFGVMFDNPQFSPKISSANVNEYIDKWAKKYIKGKNNKASVRNSNPSGTQPDKVIDKILTSRLNLSEEEINIIKYGHRVSMAAENIAGDFLEDYLDSILQNYGWHCCWGATMKSIDFCNADGRLLQVKNSDNSENSSSKTVRDGTNISHWFRRKSRTGDSNWNALNEILSITNPDDQLSEEKFFEYIENAISSNPDSISVDENNPWLKP
jgi:hypothetical protein